MPCIFDIKPEDRHCQYCSAICDERQPKSVKKYPQQIKNRKENSMTYNELAELFKQEGGDAQVCFSVISQNQILFGNNDTKKDIISFKNEEPIKWVKEAQEEPVSEQNLSNVERTLKEWKEPVSKDFEMALAEMIDKAQKCVVEPLVVAAQWKDELIKLAKSEEPVSGELEEYINELSKQFQEVSFAKLSRIAVRVAQWQKEQLIKEAIDGIARPDDDEVWCDLKSFNFKDGDKLKVIVIKED